MKRLFLGALLSVGMAGGVMALPETTIKGKWDRRNDGTVSLYRVEHGRLEEISSYKLGKGQDFGFYFQPMYEGLYVIGTGNAGAQTDKYTFYFKGGEELNIAVNDSTYLLEGKNSVENKEMYKWYNEMYKLERKSLYFSKTRSTYVDFFPDLEQSVKNAAAFKAGKTGNKKFDAFFDTYRRFNLYNIGISFLNTPRQFHPKTEEYPSFYRTFKTADFSKSAVALEIPFGVRLLSSMTRVETRVKGEERPDIATRVALVANDTLKGEMAMEDASYLKTYIGYQDMEKKFGKYFLTDDQQARAKAIVAKFATDAKKGNAALDFTYPDMDGKKISLSDFKGKVVLVDVWATWCAPCKIEIPSLIKLEEEMRGKDIVFMGVSVDEAKDHQKWKDFVKTEGLKGVQLFASGWSEITKYYGIKGIPRFLLFDKKGNIVTIDAPRPSGPELKLLIEEELKK